MFEGFREQAFQLGGEIAISAKIAGSGPALPSGWALTISDDLIEQHYRELAERYGSQQ